MGNNNTILRGILVMIFMTMMSSASKAVSISANVLGNLPNELYESSAVDFTGGTHFWSLDDSGAPNIYRIAMDGSLTRTVTITGASNRNWEDMTHDVARNNMFIGDFGNNNNDRTNLRIYKIPYPSSVSVNTIAAEEIRFTYPDQNRFPSPWMNFDAESFFHFQGKLYIFSKADGSAVGYTKMYSVPDMAGTYVATLVDSFYTNDRTTSADISPDGNAVVLISNSRIHIFRNYTGDNFFHGQHTLVSIAGSWTQKEGVCFAGNNDVYLTDENNGAGNHLYHIDLSAYIPIAMPPPPPVVTTGIEQVNEAMAGVFPNPTNESVNVWVKNSGSDKLSVAIFDLTGKMIFSDAIENPNSPYVIHTSDYPVGVYFYKVYANAKEIQTARLIISH